MRVVLLGLVVALVHMSEGIQEDRMYHSAFFRHLNTIHVTQKSWVITFQLDMDQYDEWLNNIEGVVSRLTANIFARGPLNVHLNHENNTMTQVYRDMTIAQTEGLRDIHNQLKEARGVLLSVGPLYISNNGIWGLKKNENGEYRIPKVRI